MDNTIFASGENNEEERDRRVEREEEKPLTLEEKVRLVLDTRPSVMAIGRDYEQLGGEKVFSPSHEGRLSSASLSRYDTKRKTLPSRTSSSNVLKGRGGFSRRRSSSLRDANRSLELRDVSSAQQREDVIIDNLETGEEEVQVAAEFSRVDSLRKSSVHLRHRLLVRLV